MNSLSGIYGTPPLGVAYCLSVCLGPIDWRLLFNVSQQPQPSLSLRPRRHGWHLDAGNQDVSNSRILYRTPSNPLLPARDYLPDHHLRKKIIFT